MHPQVQALVTVEVVDAEGNVTLRGGAVVPDVDEEAIAGVAADAAEGSETDADVLAEQALEAAKAYEAQQQAAGAGSEDATADEATADEAGTDEVAAAQVEVEGDTPAVGTRPPDRQPDHDRGHPERVASVVPGARSPHAVHRRDRRVHRRRRVVHTASTAVADAGAARCHTPSVASRP